MVQSDQQEFDERYITSIEICDTLDINRATVLHARKRGRLPAPIEVRRQGGGAHLLIWKRAEVSPILDEWAIELAEWRASRA